MGSLCLISGGIMGFVQKGKWVFFLVCGWSSFLFAEQQEAIIFKAVPWNTIQERAYISIENVSDHQFYFAAPYNEPSISGAIGEKRVDLVYGQNAATIENIGFVITGAYYSHINNELLLLSKTVETVGKTGTIMVEEKFLINVRRWVMENERNIKMAQSCRNITW